jgi:long-chain-acyl-CoA dehydrogenase
VTDRGLYDDEHDAFRAAFRTFVRREAEPRMADWDEVRLIDRELWHSAGDSGFVGLSGPAECGGGGSADFRFRNVIIEELAVAGANALSSSLSLQDDIVIPYYASLATDDQRDRWLRPMCQGRSIGAIAMTEPGTGSDLRAIASNAHPQPGGWRLNGRKTFITSGIQSDVVIVVARSGESEGLTLFVVERGMPGFERGRQLHKVGLDAQDTAELIFDDVFVPNENVLGEVGRGLHYLMANLPLERLSIAATAIASADAALAWTLQYVRERQAFGQRVADFQNTQFVLAEVATELDVTRSYIDRSIRAVNVGELTAVEAAKAKWWATDVQVRAIDRLLQLYGGYGYMLEYPIARAYRDARVQKIYGGTNEIMKVIIGRELIGSR